MHYYFKLGEQNSILRLERKNDIVPLVIFFGNWKYDDYLQKNVSFINNHKKKDEWQISLFFNSILNDSEAYYWIFHNRKVYLCEKLDNKIQEIIVKEEVERKITTNEGKGIYAKIIREYNSEMLPEVFFTVNANQGYNRKTINKLGGEHEIIAIFLIENLYNPKAKMNIDWENIFNYLSPIQFETLIFLIFWEESLYPTTYRGGTLANVDLTVKLQSFLNSNNTDDSFFQIKRYKTSKKFEKINQDIWLVHLGETDLSQKLLGIDWLFEEIGSKSRVNVWLLERALVWFDVNINAA